MSRPRRYESQLRVDRALATRRAIRSAARRLFEQHGFADTTIAAIAAEAGVAVPTVYATFGNKAAILGEMMDELEALAGGDETSAQRLLAEQDPRRQLKMFTHWIRTLLEKGSTILRLARTARTEPGIEGMASTGNQRRLEGTTMLTAGWHRAGALRPGLSARRAAHTLWLLTSAELYFNAVDNLGWNADSYERWLYETASRELFD